MTYGIPLLEKRAEEAGCTQGGNPLNPGSFTSVSLNKSNFQFLKGEALLAALAVTHAPIKHLVDNGGRAHGSVKHVSPETAIRLVVSGTYIGKARPGRVYYILKIDERTENKRDDSFWFERPAVRNFRSLNKAANANYQQSTEALDKLRILRRRDYLSTICRLPSGRWIED